MEEGGRTLTLPLLFLVYLRFLVLLLSRVSRCFASYGCPRTFCLLVVCEASSEVLSNWWIFLWHFCSLSLSLQRHLQPLPPIRRFSSLTIQRSSALSIAIEWLWILKLVAKSGLNSYFELCGFRFFPVPFCKAHFYCCSSWTNTALASECFVEL